LAIRRDYLFQDTIADRLSISLSSVISEEEIEKKYYLDYFEKLERSMKFLKYLLPIILLAVSSVSFSQSIRDGEVDEDDVDTFRAFLERKETAEEIPTTGIRFGGDVRAKFIHERKVTNGFNTRGSSARNPVEVLGAPILPNNNLPQAFSLRAPNDFYEIEANIEIEYLGPRDWAEIRIRYKNVPGVFFGESNRLRVMRAWMGYTLYEGPDDSFVDIEAGRYGLGDIFESKIQFDSDFDGLLLTYGHKFKCIAEFFIHGGPFIVNFRDDHYGWVGELAFLDIADTGLYTKYSFISWRKRGGIFDDVANSPNFRFGNSQALVGYRFKPDWKYLKKVRLYGAFLINHFAETKQPDLPKKDNIGWYAGIEFGQLGGAGGWLFDLNYQYIGYLAVSHFDCSGVGRGNRNDLDTNVVVNPSDARFYFPRENVLKVPVGNRSRK